MTSTRDDTRDEFSVAMFEFVKCSDELAKCEAEFEKYGAECLQLCDKVEASPGNIPNCSLDALHCMQKKVLALEKSIKKKRSLVEKARKKCSQSYANKVEKIKNRI